VSPWEILLRVTRMPYQTCWIDSGAREKCALFGRFQHRDGDRTLISDAGDERWRRRMTIWVFDSIRLPKPSSSSVYRLDQAEQTSSKARCLGEVSSNERCT
jgi:hypothetical protein